MLRYVFIIIISSFFYACPSNYIHENCDSAYYTFDFEVDFEPKDEVIPFGDTITVTSSFPRNMIPKESNEIFDFDSIDISPLVVFAKLDTPYVENFLFYPFTDFIDFYVDSIYNLRIKGNTIALDYVYSGKNYLLKFQFVPKRRGIYYFQFESAFSNPSQNENTPLIYSINTKCETNKWSSYFNTNEDYNHKELLKESIYDFAKKDMYDKWNQNYFIVGKHCFKVE